MSKFKPFEAIFGKKLTYKDEGNIFKIPVFLKTLYCEIMFAGLFRVFADQVTYNSYVLLYLDMCLATHTSLL